MSQVAARRVVVASDERLLRETVSTVLSGHGYDVHVLGSPDAAQSSAGLLLTSLDTDDSIASAAATIRHNPVPWVVVAHTPRGPGWAVLLDAGAVAVLSSATSIAEIEAALDFVLRGHPLDG